MPYLETLLAEIKKRQPDFIPLSAEPIYPDEILLQVKLEDFKKTCFSLHKILSLPVMMLFAVDQREEQKQFGLNCVFLSHKNGKWITVEGSIPEENPFFDSLAKDIYSANLFEREIKEMFGIEPRGNPDLRRLNLHDEVWPEGNFPLRRDFKKQEGEIREYKFARVEGEGIFEVPVGPVHAGIIGPGHFRFSVAGEPIINLEIRLGFTHRGVEKLFEGKRIFEAIKLAECVSGDSSFAHSLAFVQAAEKICGITVAKEVAYTRAILLELERMYNHVNDIAGIALDVGFSFPSAYASIIKEAILQLNESLAGNRYLRKTNSIGNIAIKLEEPQETLISSSLKKIMRDFRELVIILTSSISFMDRVDTTGVLRKKTAQDLGVVGLVGRASAIHIDLRQHFPGVYQDVGFKIAVQEAGDVLARLKVRIDEFGESTRLIEAFLKLVKQGDASPTKGDTFRFSKRGHFPLDSYLVASKESVPFRGVRKVSTGFSKSALGYVEGWRGPVLYWLKIDEQGIIQRCKIVDASFHNWQGLSFAVLSNIIPDFPLCNKSFDLSYSGNDL